MQRRSNIDAADRIKRQYIDDFDEPHSSSARHRHIDEQDDEQEQKYIPTFFDQLHSRNLEHVIDDILDWLDIDSLCAFSRTCKSFEQTAKSYFHIKYPSLAIDIGDEDESRPIHFRCFGDVLQHLQLSGASLDDFQFAAARVNKNLRELSFNRTNSDKKEDHIGKEYIDSISNVLENVKTVCATSCIFEKGGVEYLLANCKRIDDFGFAARKNATYRFQFQKVPTLKTLDVGFEAKAHVLELLQYLQKKRVRLDELVLSFQNDHSDIMKDVFNLLDLMYENGVFKKLYLNFDAKSLLASHAHRLVKVKGLVGIICAYRISTDMADHLLNLAILYDNIKYLAIHWMFVDSTIIAQRLTHLVELKFTEATMEAILPFVRYSRQLGHFHVEHVQGNRMLNAAHLNSKRAPLMDKLEDGLMAKHLKIYIPEKIYVKMKWSSIATKSDFVEIKREESYVPKKRY